LLLRADASYLISGGLGGLGLSVAGWMVARGARHLVLLGRRGVTDPAQEAALADLQAAGAQVTVARVDVADREQLSRVLEEMAVRQPPLRGVIHAAGVLDDGVLVQQDADRFRTVTAPKIAGGWNLHELTRHLELDHFVLFSSISSLIGSPGQANYASGNAFLDALAHHRRAAGLPAHSINWGPFSEVGLAAADAKRGARIAQRGIRSLSPSQGLAVLEQLLSLEAPNVGVVPLELEQWLAFNPAAASSPRWSLLLARRSPGGRARAGQSELARSLAHAAPLERREMLERFVVTQVAAVMGIDPFQVDQAATLTTLGMDSLMAIELRNQLQAALGVQLPATLLWKFPTVAAIVDRLLSMSLLAGVGTPSDASERTELKQRKRFRV
jgi:myxalamid-type polyketide synthase MxaB/epothilone polyketide synthase D